MPLLDAIPFFGPWRIRRDANKYRQWCAFVNTKQSGAEIFQIISVRQHARPGLKAYGRWIETGHTFALWIGGAWPSVGTFMSAPGNYGPGSHHGEFLFYARQPYYFLDENHYSAVRRI